MWHRAAPGSLEVTSGQAHPSLTILLPFSQQVENEALGRPGRQTVARANLLLTLPSSPSSLKGSSPNRRLKEIPDWGLFPKMARERNQEENKRPCSGGAFPSPASPEQQPRSGHQVPEPGQGPHTPGKPQPEAAVISDLRLGQCYMERN